MPRRFGLAFLVAAMVPSPGAAAAQAMPSAVLVALPDCPGDLGWEAVLTRLAVELRGLNVRLERDGAAAPSDGRVVLRVPGCDPDGREVEALIVRPSSGRSARSMVPLPPPTQPGRARVIALAIAEVLRRDWAGLALDLEARIAGIEARQQAFQERAQARREAVDANGEALRRSDATRGREMRALQTRQSELRAESQELAQTRAPTRHAPAMLGSVAVVGWLLPSGAVGLTGLRFGFDSSLGPLRLRLDADGALSSVAHDPGDVLTGFATGGAALLAPLSEGHVFATVGVGGRVGWAFAEGQPSDPTLFRSGRGDAVLGMLTARGSLRLPIEDVLWGVIELEVGYAFGGIDARLDERTIIELGGPVVSLAIGLEIEP